MVIGAFMAGHYPHAREIFWGPHDVAVGHPSSRESGSMTWQVLVREGRAALLMAMPIALTLHYSPTPSGAAAVAWTTPKRPARNLPAFSP